MASIVLHTTCRPKSNHPIERPCSSTNGGFFKDLIAAKSDLHTPSHSMLLLVSDAP